jgi:flagellar hook-basal body complex protein FliE
MNPLSGIRLPISPDMLRASSGAMPGGAAAIIPQAELAKLASSGLAPTSLNPVNPDFAQPSALPSALPPGAPGATFESTLGRLVGEVSGKQAAANDAVTGMMSGQGVPLHKAVIAMEEASVSFQLMVEVRNKLLDSYQELMRMQV